MYSLLYELLIYFSSPFIFFFYFFKYKGQIFSNLRERLGFLSRETKKKINRSRDWLWVHAASVGEVTTGLHLITALQKIFPEKMVVLSTVTPTGKELANKKDSANLVIYLPLDFRWAIRKILLLVKPVLLVVIETELWPNFIQQTKISGAKIVLVNGRISNRSYQRYKIFRSFIRKILSQIDFFAMRESTDAERIIALGAPLERVKVTGNMKYDLIANHQSPSTNHQEFGFQPNDLIWVCGSTGKGEEKIILEVYLEVLKKYPNLKLILAPRYLERIPEIEDLLKAKDISFIYKSQLPVTNNQLPITCLLWDSYGELMNAYALATIVFVGGSLVPQEGHNILEPAALGKPVIFGPYMESFQEVAERLLSSGGAIQVKNGEELKLQILNLLGSLALREKIGINALQAVRNKESATDKNIELIKSLL